MREEEGADRLWIVYVIHGVTQMCIFSVDRRRGGCDVLRSN